LLVAGRVGGMDVERAGQPILQKHSGKIRFSPTDFQHFDWRAVIALRCDVKTAPLDWTDSF